MNKDQRVIDEFGGEWTRFRYDGIDRQKVFENFQQYFEIFPWECLMPDAEGFDMGCGTGRWAQFVAPRVAILNCIDPSRAITVARANLSHAANVRFYNETTESCTLQASSQDFGYSLGVLHHIPDTLQALRDCSRLLKSGAPFLLYLYYSFDNKPVWYAWLWRLSDLGRRVISTLPSSLKALACEVAAATVYLPFARAALMLERIGVDVANFPLSDYRHKPFYQMRNDSLDRFGTRLEQRFSKSEIEFMLEQAGFERITFSEKMPFWCCVAFKR